MRQIRSDSTPRYPGVEVPLAEDGTSPATLDANTRRLAPALDAGIAVQTRVGRQRANAERRQWIAAASAIAAVAVLISAAIGWRYVSDRQATASPLMAESPASASPNANISSARAAITVSAPKLDAETPIFASYMSVKLHLPVAMRSLTEVGFHQASYPYALRLKTPMKDANLELAAKNRSTGRNRRAEPSGPNAVMTGLVIRMWRNRPGRPDTAVDVGALAGTTVMAPVAGTIVKIKPYLLYGKYPDFELHIHPDGTDGLDLVMIHLTNLSCSVGDHVDAGLTPIARVRKLSDKFHDQLADYTKSPGDHVHIQINDANYPHYKGLIGAITPGATGTAGSTDENDRSDYSQGD